MRTAFIYTDAYFDYDYGPTHPLKIIRLKLTYELIHDYGLLSLPSVQFIMTKSAEEKDLTTLHSQEYVTLLKQGIPITRERMSEWKRGRVVSYLRKTVLPKVYGR